MKYEVRKGGKVYMSTEQKRCHYSKKIEEAIQAAGYGIYVDGHKKACHKEREQKKWKMKIFRPLT